MSLTSFQVRLGEGSSNFANLQANLAAYERQEGLIFISAFGYTTHVKAAATQIKRTNAQITIARQQTKTFKGEYEIIQSHLPNSEYSHMVIYKKDATYYTETGEERLRAFIFLDIPEDEDLEVYKYVSRMTQEIVPSRLQRAVFEKLYKLSPVPIIEEWIPFLINGFIHQGELRNVWQNRGERRLMVYALTVSISDLVLRISEGLKNQRISIGNTTQASEFMQEVIGIDAYLHNFSDVLTEKIQRSFKPLFVPSKAGDKYSPDLNVLRNYIKTHDKIDLYHAQLDVTQSIVNVLKRQRCASICAEMGSGLVFDAVLG